MHTPPQLGAATAGLVGGIQEMYGGQPVLSPMHFVRGLATAGVDMATAKIVGGTLGALGGLTPAAQEKLQDVGLWADPWDRGCGRRARATGRQGLSAAWYRVRNTLAQPVLGIDPRKLSSGMHRAEEGDFVGGYQAADEWVNQVASVHWSVLLKELLNIPIHPD